MRSTPIIPSAGVALGGLLLAIGGSMHPDGAMDTLENHMVTMLENPIWIPSHVIAGVGTLLLAVSLAWLARSGSEARLKPFLIVAALGALVGAVEYIPHTAAVAEADAYAHHAATPIIDIHLMLAFVAGPAFGFASAALAIAVAVMRTRRRMLWWLAAVPAVLGGLAYGIAAPLVAFTGDPAVTVLFPGIAGVALWYLIAGVAFAVSAARARTLEPAFASSTRQASV